VVSNPGESTFFWVIDEWVCVALKRVNALLQLHPKRAIARWYAKAVALRVILSFGVVKDIVLWKMVEPESFKKEAEAKARHTLRHLLDTSLLCHIYLVLIKALNLVPQGLFDLFCKVTGRTRGIANYEERKRQFLGNDSGSRGI